MWFFWVITDVGSMCVKVCDVYQCAWKVLLLDFGLLMSLRSLDWVWECVGSL